MRKLVLSLFLFLVFHVVGITQVLETKRINNFNGYIDLGTYLIANFASINVEYNLIQKKEYPKLLLRAGLSNALIASLFDDGKYYGGIVGLTYLMVRATKILNLVEELENTMKQIKKTM